MRGTVTRRSAFEHSRQVVVSGAPSRGAMVLEARRARLCNGDGVVRLTSTLPPEARLPACADVPSRRRIGAALAAIPGATLSYSALAFARRTVTPVDSGLVRTGLVWAVTGQLDDGTPLGWSGRGDGLAWLEESAAREVAALAGLAAMATQARAGRAPGVGPYDAVLSPAAAAVLLHEAVGHAVEAPANGSGEDKVLGRRVASAALTLHDDPLAGDGPAHYEADDDNVRALGPTPVVEQGVLLARLHTASSAARAGVLPTANARAASAWDDPLPRVSNLVCAAGGWTEDELVEGVGDGLYVHRLANGVSDGVRVEADVLAAEWIRAGRRTGEPAAVGRLREDRTVLHRLLGMGDKPVFHRNAMCGKRGQLLYDVGTCAPAVSVAGLRVA